MNTIHDWWNAPDIPEKVTVGSNPDAMAHVRTEILSTEPLKIWVKAKEGFIDALGEKARKPLLIEVIPEYDDHHPSKRIRPSKRIVTTPEQLLRGVLITMPEAGKPKAIHLNLYSHR